MKTVALVLCGLLFAVLPMLPGLLGWAPNSTYYEHAAPRVFEHGEKVPVYAGALTSAAAVTALRPDALPSALFPDGRFVSPDAHLASGSHRKQKQQPSPSARMHGALADHAAAAAAASVSTILLGEQLTAGALQRTNIAPTFGEDVFCAELGVTYLDAAELDAALHLPGGGGGGGGGVGRNNNALGGVCPQGSARLAEHEVDLH